MHPCIHLKPISVKLQALSKIESSQQSTESAWIRSQSGRLIRTTKPPIPEVVRQEKMADRQSGENSQANVDEPRFTRAEVEVMIKEAMAAQLAELGLTMPNRTQFTTAASGQNKGKEPEIFDPVLNDQDPEYYKNLYERTRNNKGPIEIPDDSVKGKSAMEERMESMEKIIGKLQAQLSAKNEKGYDLEEYTGDTSGRGPTEKLHKPAKFDGDGDPVVHLNQYVLIAKLNRLSPQFILDWFSTSLQGPALIWYHSLDRSKKANWVELSKAFLDHFSFNTTMNVGLRELEITTQKRDESFIDYLTRWRKRLILIKNRPDESELIEMFIKGTLPEFRNKLYFIPLKDFSEVYKMGIRIENRLNEEKRANAKPGFSGNRGGNGFGKQSGSSGSGNDKSGVGYSVNSMRNGGERRFSNLGLPLSKILERCIKRGLLQPLEPKPLPDPLPANFNLQAYCKFHQVKGHYTDKCHRLRHEIQDLIDQGKIPNPDKITPRTGASSSSDYRSVTPA